jgi:hypothetical protein
LSDDGQYDPSAYESNEIVEVLEAFVDYKDFSPNSKVLYGRHYLKDEFCKVGFIWPHYGSPYLYGKGVKYHLGGEVAKGREEGNFYWSPESGKTEEYFQAGSISSFTKNDIIELTA